MHTSTPAAGTGESAIVATYDTHLDAEVAIRALQEAGQDMRKFSIVGKNYQTEEEVVGYYTTGDRMKAWGAFGAFWGGLWGVLAGSALFVIPGIGPLMVAGPLVAMVVGAVENAVVVGGISALGAGLYSLGIPKDSIIEFETNVKAGKFVVITNGPGVDVVKSKRVLANLKHHELQEHAELTRAM